MKRCKGRPGGVETLLPVRVLREITRLGQDLHKRATFHPDAVKRSLAALDRFDREIRKEHMAPSVRPRGRRNEETSGLGVDWAGGICTAAFRTAKNGPELLRRIRNRYGWDLRIVSANQEAGYAMRGILHGLAGRRAVGGRRKAVAGRAPSPRLSPIAHRLLVIDIGGGSTEFIVYDGKVRGIQTTPLGVVRLTETHLHHDPPLSSEVVRLNTAIDKELAQMDRRLKVRRFTIHDLQEGGSAARGQESGAADSRFTIFVGTAGTVTTLAALKKKMRRYDPKKISGTRLTRRDLERLLRRLIAVPAKSRLRFPGMEKGREDLILAGIAILLRSMDRFDLPALTVSDSGILEGIALSAHSKHLPIAGGLYPTQPPLTKGRKKEEPSPGRKGSPHHSPPLYLA